MSGKDDSGSRFKGSSFADLRKEIDACRACPLWERATHGVPGEGDPHARVMFVGEQPGDQEDKTGRPFVGPAGRILDEALAKAGVDRADAYVTNTVKHFSWIPRGKRRIHKTPLQSEIAACFDWLEGEIRLLRPHVIACLGATAAKTLLGRNFRVSIDRGKLIAGGLAPFVLATIHPSAILRITDDAERDKAFEDFVADLAQIRKALRRERP